FAIGEWKTLKKISHFDGRRSLDATIGQWQKRSNVLSRVRTMRISFERKKQRQPAFRSFHRSRHEGAEARADVWGDAAGTAPAVTSVTRLVLRLSHRFSGTTKVRLNRAPIRRASCFWV